MNRSFASACIVTIGGALQIGDAAYM